MDANMPGKRVLVLARSTSIEQNDIESQIEALRKHASQVGLTVVGELRFAGVRGHEMNENFEELIARKAEQNDFDAILVQHVYRLSRHGVEHTVAVLDKLEAAGIVVMVLSVSP